jgi:hypothetical protein
MDKKIEFVINSINDIQGTIRAIDAKFFGTIALFLLPLTEIDEISKAFKNLYTHGESLTSLVLIVLIIVWLIGIILSFTGIYSISNPSHSICGVSEAKTKGLFYQPNQFKLNFFSQFFSGSVKSKQTLLEIIEETKLEENDRFNELVYEQIKLAYIRDVKITRQKSATIFLLVTIILLLSSVLLNYLIS